MIDDAINIRGIKRYAAENAGDVPIPEKLPATGKKVAVVGGGPSGLTTAYYLALMGHSVTIYERRNSLGGMLRYGIPAYRLPRKLLDSEIETILSAGIEVKTGISIGSDIKIEDLADEYDSVYLSIGAHGSKKLGIAGESLEGVFSAVELLGDIGDERHPDFKDKNVVVVGGGNVAMDATRTAKRLGAKKVTCVYRRRIQDMTALPEEVEGAMSEGCEILSMFAPVSIDGDDSGKVTGLTAQRQMSGEIDRGGRPAPVPVDDDYKNIPADILILAIGQDVEKEYLSSPGEAVKRGALVSGGDCVSGPATVILAIAAGKDAANIIDQELGFNHELLVDIDIPKAKAKNKRPAGRANMTEREATERMKDFEEIENSYCDAEAMQEADRCLRCDHFGFGSIRQ